MPSASSNELLTKKWLLFGYTSLKESIEVTGREIKRIKSELMCYKADVFNIKYEKVTYSLSAPVV